MDNVKSYHEGTGRRWLSTASVATVALSLAACAAQIGEKTNASDSRRLVATSKGLAEQIQRAHGKGSIYDRPPLQGRIVVDFGGRRALEAQLTYHAASGRVRLDYDDGRTAVFDGKTAWAAGFDGKGLASSRFHLLTWTYFVAAPWKLSDPGVVLGAPSPRSLMDRPHETARMTFVGEVGDTPDDWYMVYADPESFRLVALAYVVTYGKSVEQASAEPHVATYEDVSMIDGLRIATTLNFYDWSEPHGIAGDQIGKARFTALRFAAVPENHFAPPEGAVEVSVPEAPR